MEMDAILKVWPIQGWTNFVGKEIPVKECSRTADALDGVDFVVEFKRDGARWVVKKRTGPPAKGVGRNDELVGNDTGYPVRAPDIAAFLRENAKDKIRLSVGQCE